MGTLRLFTLLLITPFSLLHSQTETKNEDVHQKWRLGLSGGMSYIIGNTDEAKNAMTDMGISPKLVDDYYGDLKLGMMAGADFQYFFKPNFGAGIKYLFHSNSTELGEKVSLPLNGDGVTLFYGRVKEQLYLNYIGPSFIVRRFFGSQQKWSITSLLSLGYVHYRNEALIADMPFLQTGSTLGSCFAVEMEYHFTDNIALGVDLSCLSAVLSKYKMSNGYSTETIDLGNDPENLSRLNFGLNLKYSFNNW